MRQHLDLRPEDVRSALPSSQERARVVSLRTPPPSALIDVRIEHRAASIQSGSKGPTQDHGRPWYVQSGGYGHAAVAADGRPVHVRVTSRVNSSYS